MFVEAAEHGPAEAMNASSGHNLRSKGKLAAEHAAGHRPSDGKGDSAGAAAPLPLSKANFPHIRQVRAPRVQPQNSAGG